MHLTVPNDLVVKANDLQAPGAPIGLGAINVTLGGDLWVSKVPWDQVRLVGRVNTVRGTYDFQGRRFDILRDGVVRFDGTDDARSGARHPHAARHFQGVTANVTLGGTLNRPVVVLTSTPPLEQADILSLIVFNQPINQLGEGQQVSLAARAQQLATGAVAGQISQSIGKALGLDTFEIGTAPDSGAAAHITVGQQVGKNLYVKVEQDVGDQNQTSFILEYELTKWLRLRTNLLQGSPTHAAALPARARQRHRPAVLFQLLRWRDPGVTGSRRVNAEIAEHAEISGQKKTDSAGSAVSALMVKIMRSPAEAGHYPPCRSANASYAVASDATWTRASLKQAPRADIGQRVRDERRAGHPVSRVPPPEPFRQADRARADRRLDRQRCSAPRRAR